MLRIIPEMTEMDRAAAARQRPLTGSSNERLARFRLSRIEYAGEILSRRGDNGGAVHPAAAIRHHGRRDCLADRLYRHAVRSAVRFR